MINKFPAMVRVIDPEIYPEITRSLLKIDKNSQIARGVCFLTIPRFYHETVEDMTSEELRDLFISMTTAINYIIEESISQNDTSIIPISPFFNVGGSVGGSLRRLHCQIYMDLSQDGHGSRMESFLKTFEKMNERNQCQICDSKHGDGSRIIFDTEDWVIFSSGSPIRNYHLRFAPKEHIEDLSEINAKKFLSLAKTLKVLSMVLNDMGVNNERNIIFNTRPYGYNSYFHLFGDILPYEHVGGAEMADSMRVVRISPKKVAKDARKIIRTKYSNLL
ncbi:MAG: hypothetical protein GY870_20315 [archaeon]|nr:hypothetical protein [archaeon]